MTTSEGMTFRFVDVTNNHCSSCYTVTLVALYNVLFYPYAAPTVTAAVAAGQAAHTAPTHPLSDLLALLVNSYSLSYYTIPSTS
jgi:hypothetical protein